MLCGIVKMFISQFRTLLLLASIVTAAGLVWTGCKTDIAAPPVPTVKVGQIEPQPGAGRIAYEAARLLEVLHYSQQPLDAKMSEKFFDQYIDILDGRHEHFLQSDLEEFSVYRTNLNQLTLTSSKNADLSPAFAIYDRFALRYQQHNAYVNELLARDRFKFTTDEKYIFDRRHEPFPKDLNEAKDLWRQRLHYEILQEKLSREISETNGQFTVKLPPGTMTNITDLWARHYRWQLRQTTNRDASDVLQFYLDGLAHAYDPHSDYFSAPKAQDFSLQMNLALFGIGAKLQEDDGFCVIKELVAGGPAMKSKKLKVDDRIVAVAQADKPAVDVVDMELSKVVQMIRGPKNTEVKLTISPAENRGLRREVVLTRDEIKLEDAEAKARLIEQPDGRRIGIIDLPSFYAPVSGLERSGTRTTPRYTSVDVAKLIEKLKKEKISGLILDLRSNPGGSLEEAVKFTGLFIKDGPVVLARFPDSRVMVDTDPDPGQVYDGPLMVLVNRFSASASEIAAAALQDYDRAIVVGDSSTHGKGTVQNLNPLQPLIDSDGGGVTNDPGTLKVTIRKFYRISGGSTQFKGVVPDIVLPDTWNYSTIVGEQAMENALPWDTIRPVSHADYNLVEPFIEQLRAASESRVKNSQDFKYIEEDIAQFKKFQQDRSGPLNESVAIKERERVAKQNKARQKEREARPDFPSKIYEVTLKVADEDGLPAPLPVKTNSVAVKSVSPHEKSSETAKENNSEDGPKVFKPRPGDDPMLEEAANILNDYISVLVKNGNGSAK